ncbi:MAG TPA: DUF348 domain-containing protein [Epulopiscium sp.]|nr:DUF348 domain-containing protein [Candidatus Epulonipiscium sp.]
MKIRNRIALLIVALFVLGTGTIAAYQTQSTSVTITDDGKVTQYETTELLVGEFLASNNIRLQEKDEISVDVGTSIIEDMEIVIKRWAPEVILNLDNVEMKTITKAYTIDKFLEEQGIILGNNDTVSPKISESIKPGMKIIVKREKTTIQKRDADLPYDVKVETTLDLKPGERQVKQAGNNGLVTRDFQVDYFGGEMIKETQISSLVLRQPQTEIILEGAKNIVTDPNTGKTYTFKKTLDMEATAYTHGPNDPWYNKTASGMPTFVGMVAVDRNTIPLGTKLYVEGYGIAHAGDVGGAVKGNIIDLYMNSEKEARAFGRRARKVYILEDQTLDVRAERS